MWICPYCHNRIRLTWGRYFAAWSVTRKCPHCKRLAGLDDGPPWLWFVRIAGFLAGGVPLAILVGSKGGLHPAYAGLVLGGCLTGFPVDKYLDAHYRQLKRI